MVFAATISSYYPLGAYRISLKVAEGNISLPLAMMWPKEAITGTSLDHFEEYTAYNRQGQVGTSGGTGNPCIGNGQ